MFRVLDFASASWPRAGYAAMAAVTSWLLVGCWITAVVDLLPPPQPTTNAAIARRVAGFAAVLKKEPMAHVSGTDGTILSPWLSRSSAATTPAALPAWRFAVRRDEAHAPALVPEAGVAVVERSPAAVLALFLAGRKLDGVASRAATVGVGIGLVVIWRGPAVVVGVWDPVAIAIRRVVAHDELALSDRSEDPEVVQAALAPRVVGRPASDALELTAEHVDPGAGR